MRSKLSSSISKSAFFFAVLVATAHVAPAQALVSAQRGAEITPFAQTVLLSPDWGPTRNLGYTVGVDYTRFIRSIVQPSIEFRLTNANGIHTSERSLLGGLKLGTSVHGLHPYATVLFGNGRISFADPNVTIGPDYSFLIYSLGGGADFNVTSQWALRLDYTRQTWNVAPQIFNPVTLGVGVAYRIPFHNGRVK